MDELTRTVDGRLVPVPRRWVFDAADSEIAFSVKHMMISRVHGTFREFAGEVVVADRPEESTASVRIVAASIDTAMPSRDRDLRSPDFLDVEVHETIEFASTSVKARGGEWELRGDLAVAGQTREVTLDVEFRGAAVDPWGNQNAVFSATAEIAREDWGLTYSKAIEGGGVLVGSKVTIEVEIRARPAVEESDASPGQS